MRSILYLLLGLSFLCAVMLAIQVQLLNLSVLSLSESAPLIVHHPSTSLGASPKSTNPAEGKFCGGIATGAFPCPVGYSCKLDGSFPDASGHCVKDAAVADVSGSSTSLTASWKTYRNDQYGFQFKYAAAAQINPTSSVEDENNVIALSFNDPSNFSGYLNDGSVEEQLKYDQTKQKWQIYPGINETAAQLCPLEEKTKLQQASFYQVGDFRPGRNWDYAYVTKNGIIMLSVSDFSLPFMNDPKKPYLIDPASIIFDNPKDIISVSCDSKIIN